MFRRVLEAIRGATHLPMIPKLAPNVADITAFARAAESCGANAGSLINSFPAMAVDVKTRKPKLANVTGGLTGPAVRPIAVRLVWQAAKSVSIPVIGMGGISKLDDALEFFIVGASAVALGTVNFTNPSAAAQMINGLRDYLAGAGMCGMDELVGTVLV
jgi:dihydroorotate dehydrogenase (NAD+) catalytic subunit